MIHRTAPSRVPLAIVVTFFLALACGPARSGGEFCDIASGKLDACDGKLVQVTGKSDHHPEQHPMLAHDKEQQSYWDVNNSGQWVFVSDTAIDCGREVLVTGILDARTGPCDPKAQNKNQYCGTAIYVKTWQCR